MKISKTNGEGKRLWGARVFSPARLSSLLHGLPRNFARPTLIARPIESGRKRKVRFVVRTKIHFRGRSRSLSSPLANRTEPLRGFFARLRDVRAMHSSNTIAHFACTARFARCVRKGMRAYFYLSSACECVV